MDFSAKVRIILKYLLCGLLCVINSPAPSSLCFYPLQLQLSLKVPRTNSSNEKVTQGAEPDDAITFGLFTLRKEEVKGTEENVHIFVNISLKGLYYYLLSLQLKRAELSKSTPYRDLWLFRYIQLKTNIGFIKLNKWAISNYHSNLCAYNIHLYYIVSLNIFFKNNSF